VLGVIDDFWERYVTDVGNVGPDRGQGRQVPAAAAGYTGDVPDGYFVLRSRTYGQLMFFRGFVGARRPAAGGREREDELPRLPAGRAADPPAMRS
jgi:hypothetical protein